MEFVLQCENGLNLCSQQDSGGATPLHYTAIRRDDSILVIILKVSMYEQLGKVEKEEQFLSMGKDMENTGKREAPIF